MNEKTNDMDARFEQFYAANFPRVKNFARLLTKSEEDAEDIAQNIFLKLWTRPDLWQGQESMTGYLYTVTRNEIFNLFKHQKVEQEYESHIIRSQLIGELCDEDTSLLENLYYKEIVLLVELALNQLPPRRKQGKHSRAERLIDAVYSMLSVHLIPPCPYASPSFCRAYFFT